MARLSDFSESERKHHQDKIRDLPDFGQPPYVPGPALRRRRVAQAARQIEPDSEVRDGPVGSRAARTAQHLAVTKPERT
jgi:hypothetical protein